MTADEQKNVHQKIDSEGFDYTFVHYSNFKEIKDRKFHQLRAAYLQARGALAYYVEYGED